MATTTRKDPRGALRLSKDGARWYRACAPGSQYQLARVRGVDPTQVTRELAGERRSPLAAMEQEVRRLAASGRTTAGPYLAHLHRLAGAGAMERPVGEKGSVLAEADRRCEEETRTQGAADVAQLRFRASRSVPDLEALEDAALEHLGATLDMLHWLPRVRAAIEGRLP